MTVYSYAVRPFDAPATFERLVKKVLQSLLKICLVYLDDIIFGKSFGEAIQRMREVFLRFRAANLKQPKNVFSS